jgi:hypothetical protein
MKKPRRAKRSGDGKVVASPRPLPALIADVAGAADNLKADLSERYKYYLRKWGYGRKRPR